jgi:hypothetical protein
MSNSRLVRPVAAVLLFSCIALSLSGAIPAAMDRLGLKSLKTSNERYLQGALEKTLTTFAVLSAVKVGLAVVQGSDVGIGFSLEVGDVVQSAYDYVDIAWRTMLVCAAVLLGTRYLLQAAVFIGPWFLAALFACLGVSVLLGWRRLRWKTPQGIVRDLALWAGLGAVLLYLVLPLSVAGGRILSERITRPAVEEARAGLSGVRQDMELASAPQGGGLWSKFTEAKDRLAAVVRIVKTKAERLSEWILQLIAGLVFDCLVFPALLFLFLYGLTRKGGRYLIDFQKSRRFQADLVRALERRPEAGRE